MKKLMLIIFAIAITMIACKKESVLLNNNDGILKESQLPSNSKNPYDIAGQIHNRAMDAITADKDFMWSSTINRDDINCKVADYLKEREGCIVPPVLFSPEIQKQYKLLIKSDNLPKLLTDNYGWSETGVEYIKEL